ncbi:MAG TPA: response regulator transcription factor [Sulfurovum sp.]|uniref:response regulator transcription factor n=1 Tax=Sulfurovum sp. TaxID=1969726 RepID=UPI002F955901
MIRVAIADDHEIVRNGLIMLIDQEKDMEVHVEASSFTELISKLKKESADLLILDLNLGDKNGIESIENVSNLFPALPILVLSMYPEEPYAIQTFKAGASGYLNKTVISSELIKAIHKITSGKKYISESLAENLAYGFSLEKSEKDPIELLSKREYEVLSLIASGQTYKDIATKLDLSPKTVSTYRTRILEKLNLTSTAQLLRFAYENNISSY